MTSSYKDNIENYYQIPDDAAPAGTEIVDADLIDYFTGVSLVDAISNESLVGDIEETVVLSSSGECTPVVICNDAARAASVDVVNLDNSEVSTSLLGVPRSETALMLFDCVNIYGINSKEWGSNTGYTYYYDPTEWTFEGNYGYYTRHLPAESAAQAYVYPRATSFVYPFDDGTGKYPGGYTDGVQSASFESKRAFRYQPGRVTGFTLGVRMSTESGHDGEVIQWGCRNSYGDGYYFQLEKGTDLYIVRTSPDLGTLKVPREEWNGDKLFVGEGITGWGLDLSKVTMFKIEFSWYGAVGAQFLAYVPDGNDEARWVKLHYISAEDRFIVPSLRSAYLRLFTSVTTTAGTEQAAFINLYGSSVYIDGGDKGTVLLGTAALEGPKPINTSPRSLIGLNIKGTINGVDNQKIVYPVSLSAYASVPTRFDLIFRGNTCAGVQYGYGTGTSISRTNSANIAVTKTAFNRLTIASGAFPDLSAELSGGLNYLTGRRVKVEGSGLYTAHVTAISGTTGITLDKTVPDGLTSIRLSRFNAWAVASGAITSGVTSGSILKQPGGGYWRIGLWPQASGVYNGTQTVVWAASSYSRQAFAWPNGYYEEGLPPGCNESSSFSIARVSGATPSYTINAGGNVLTVSGTSNPWPIALVAELMDGASISDVTIFEGSNIETVGSGTTRAITTFSVLSGVTESSVSAGGNNYAAHKFENALCDPLSAVMVDRQGSKTMPIDNRVATFFIGADETKQYSLSHVFGPDKMFITGPPGSQFNTGGLFVMATTRTGSGIASAMLNWEEQ